MGTLVSKQLFQPPQPVAPRTAPLFAVDRTTGRLRREIPLTVSNTAVGPIVSVHGLPTASTLFLFFHGNAEDLGTCEDTVNQLAVQFDAQCWALEYAGYGVLSNRTASQDAIYADVDALADGVIQYVGQTPRITRIVCFGFSLGTAIALRAALRYNAGRLRSENGCSGAIPSEAVVVALAPFTSAFSTRISMADRMPFLKPFDFFCSTCMLSGASDSVPMIIMHGTSDRVVPYALGQQLYSMIQGPKAFITLHGANHGNLLACDLQGGTNTYDYIVVGGAERSTVLKNTPIPDGASGMTLLKTCLTALYKVLSNNCENTM